MLSTEDEDSSKGQTYADLLVNYRDTTKTRKWLVSHFCDVVLRTRGKINSDHNDLPNFWFNVEDFKYDPRQSLFVYGLCVNVDEASRGTERNWEPYQYRNYKEVYEEVIYTEALEPIPLDITTYWQDDVTLNQLRWIPSQDSLDAEQAYSTCNPAQSMQWCNFPSFLKEIFNTILSEYTDIKLANVYGYKVDFSDDEKYLEQAVNDFSASYFNDDPRGTIWPCNVEDMPYLNADNAEDKSKHCSHPETRSKVKNIIKSAADIVRNLDYLDHEAIMNPFEDKEKTQTLPDYCNWLTAEQSRTSPNHLLHACSFTKRGDIAILSDWTVFSNLMLNELMWYNLFLDYYANKLGNDLSYQNPSYGSTSFSYRRNLREINLITFEKSLSQQAIYQSRRMLMNLKNALPAYIALESYKEDIIAYRNTLAKTYTPLNQLYHTFRNVQACNAQWF